MREGSITYKKKQKEKWDGDEQQRIECRFLAQDPGCMRAVAQKGGQRLPFLKREGQGVGMGKDTAKVKIRSERTPGRHVDLEQGFRDCHILRYHSETLNQSVTPTKSPGYP